MKKIFALFAGTLFVPALFAQSLIILDEGYNTQQRLDIPTKQRKNQGCSSMKTLFSSVQATGEIFFLAGSLCTDENKYLDFGTGVAEHTNTRRYSHSAFGNTANFDIRLRKSVNGLQRGEHGNWVSNAAYDFDSTLDHRIWQVFGIDHNDASDDWVTTNRSEDEQVPGETIALALDEIGIFSDSMFVNGSEQRNLGAVVMSLGANAGGVSDLRCGAGDGQASVDDLFNKGIAVVVALPNEDVSSNKETWPARA